MTTSAAQEVSGHSRQLVVFTLGEHDFGVPITSVQEIIRYTPPRPIPDGDPCLEGVINLRGRIIPVVNLHTRFGCTPADIDRKIVVVETEGITTGLVVDAVSEVLRVAEEDVEAPPTHATGGASGESVEGIAKLGGRLLLILDLTRVLGDVRAGAAHS